MASEIAEAKSLRWLANMWPFVNIPKDDCDRMSNAIHLYCEAGAAKIEELQKEIERLKSKNDE